MKDQYIQLCCEFYNEHSPKDREWFGRMYDQCQEEYEKNNICMHRWQFPLMVLKSQQGRIKELEQWNQNQYDLINKLQNQIDEANLQIAVHWGADEDTDSVLKDIEKALCGCKHEHNGMMYMSDPPKYKCKKCGEFYLSSSNG